MLAALRDDVLLPRLLPAALPLFEDAERFVDALRVALDADAAERPRDLLLVRFLLVLRDELFLLDFPRDFLALVAIDASPRSR